ncbi:MAG: type II glyceraldehyde-3-phosphate dehydrogenase [Thermoplasmataceae archaeon]
MIKVAVNGYGTIGRRVALAVALQPDMKVTGIVKTTPDYLSRLASRKFDIYVPDENAFKRFKEAGIEVSGLLPDLIAESDIVVDSTPEGIGEKNKPLYTGKVNAIFQGGESSNVAEESFNAYSSYKDCYGKKSVRVVSCNTTGLARSLYPIHSSMGINHVNATLIRRAVDPNDSKKGPINAIEPSLKFPSHHGPDVRTVIKGLDIDTVAVKVPTTLMHVHVVEAKLNKTSTRAEVINAWRNYRRIRIISGKDGLTSTAQVMDYAREGNRDRSDLYEIVIWDESVSVRGDRLNYIQAVHQESIVVPENVDAIRSSMGAAEQKKSIDQTDQSLKINDGVFY